MVNQSRRNDQFCDLAVLNKIAADPDISQALLAEALNISIGSVNGRLKRLVEQGYIEVKRISRRKLRYIITPKGRALQKTLADDYTWQSFQLFRQVRQQVQNVLTALESSGVRAVRLLGEGDIADVCRLTCLENGFALTEDVKAPALVVDGLEIRIERP